MKYCTLHSCHIEDVERGAELSFSGRDPLRGHMVREADPPLHHRQILFSTNQIFHQTFLVSDRTDGRTDRRNKYVLVGHSVAGLCKQSPAWPARPAG